LPAGWSFPGFPGEKDAEFPFLAKTVKAHFFKTDILIETGLNSMPVGPLGNKFGEEPKGSPSPFREQAG
jgi:hypothetical protein